MSNIPITIIKEWIPLEKTNLLTDQISNNINWDLILSCETLEVYKPKIEAYTKTAKLLQLDPSECCMVACHSFDLNAAKMAGFKTIFIKRAMEWGKNTKINVDGEYDLVLDSFKNLKEILY